LLAIVGSLVAEDLIIAHQATQWPEAIKAAPDEKAIHLLIARINVGSKTEIAFTRTSEDFIGKKWLG